VQFDLRVLKFFKIGEHGKLDFVGVVQPSQPHERRSVKPGLWCGELAHAGVRYSEQSGHSEATAVLY
jgi:hypothetical protein